MSASFTVKIDKLKELAKRISSSTEFKSEYQNVLRSKGLIALVIQAIADNFNKQGPGWAPLKAQTIRSSVSKKLRKKLSELTNKQLVRLEKNLNKRGEAPNRMILQKTGLLKKSVTVPNFSGMSYDKKSKTAHVATNVYKVEGTNLIWGTDLVYAGTHQNGNPKRNIPARPFLKVREEYMAQINEYLASKVTSLLKKAINGGFR